MFGINNNNNAPGAPMVPDGDGIDQPTGKPAMPDGPATDKPMTFDPPAPTNNSTPPPPPTPPPADDDLIKLKQQALQSLAPLVGHLDQTPEEKFKTTMMMLQASDNAELVKDAYAAANAITDEKTRAQALLDVVNEINYFTQHNKQP